jgi:enoyl-CoA hydratase/carnithine racemase
MLEVVIGRPLLSLEVLRALARRLDEARSQPRPLVVSSSHPSIFLAGAHLAEIASLDAATARPYALAGREVIDRLASFPAPVVAAVHGPCAGGGFDLVLACDEVVAGPGATFHHPGAARGLVTGWGGSERLPARIGHAAARRALVAGEPLRASTAVELGLAVPVQEDPVGAARTRARALARIEPRRLEMWRTLRRGRFVDRFRAVVVHP